MLADALRHLLDTDQTTIAQLAAYGECGETTVRQQVAERDAKCLRRLRRWIRFLPTPAGQQLLDALTDGRAVLAPLHAPALDLNGDGRVDAADVLHGVIELTERVAATTRQARDAMADGRFTPEESIALTAAMRAAEQMAETLGQVIHQAGHKDTHRRRASWPAETVATGSEA